MQHSLTTIAKLVDGIIIGDADIKITTLSPLDNIETHALVFADSAEHVKHVEESTADAILVSTAIKSSTKTLIQVSNPTLAFIKLLQYFYPTQQPIRTTHPTAVIHKDVKLGKNISIAPNVVIESGANIEDNCVIKANVYIGHDVTIKSNSTIHPNVVIYDRSQIGKNVIIHASSVIGSDGFGYKFENGQHVKVPHVGQVIIEDDVEIGANTVIDRATLGATVIGKGTKIDNFVQIAHSVKLGKSNILCAFTGVAGSTISGDNVIFAANVGVSDHVRIDDGVILGARAGVPPKKHLKSGNIYLGNPARPKDKAIEMELSATRIPIMRRNMQSLSARVGELEKQIGAVLEK